MVLLTSVLGMSLQLSSAVSVSCENLQDIRGPVMHSSTGFAAAVALHSEDDHGKNTHLCLSQYDLIFSGPAGTPNRRDNIDNSDDAWGRPISFQIAGFARKGTQVAVVITEGRLPTNVEIILYDMTSSSAQSSYVPSRFITHLGNACSKTLHLSGSLDGFPVISTSVTSTCAQAKSWLVKPIKEGRVRVSSLPWPKLLSSAAPVDPIELGVAEPTTPNSR